MNIIDLTQDIDINTQVFPGSPNVNLLKWSNFETHQYISEAIFCSTHVGTHIDAPFHFKRDGITVEKISLDRLYVNNSIKVIKIDKVENEIIEVCDLENYHIKSNDTILLNTNWANNNKLKKYFESNPGLSHEAASYLAEKKINLIGIDGPSIDPALDSEFGSHMVFSSSDIPIIENLTNLDKIVNKKEIIFVALPLRLKDCSGSPVRAIAIINE